MEDEVLLLKLEKVKTDDQMDGLGFTCLETVIHLFGNTKEDPNVWVWQHSKSGLQVTMYDEGHGKCSYIAVVREPAVV